MVHITRTSEPSIPAFNIQTPALTRGLDLVAAGLGLLLLAPLFLVIALAVRLSSPGPVFYRAERAGRGGRPFKLYKFRSMVQDAARRGPGITVKGDARVTRVGRVLRRSKLDELPQLLNVLRGEMSLVGPRPEDPRYLAWYTPEQRQILAVRPGITSAASLHYREEDLLLAGDDPETVYRERILPHKLALELAYLRQRSLRSDLLLILCTVGAVGRGPQLLEALLKVRNRHLLALDLLALALLPALALALRLEGFGWWPLTLPALGLFTLVALAIKLPIFFGMGLYSRYWRYAGVNDLAVAMGAASLSTLALTILFVDLHSLLAGYGLAMFRTVPIIDGLLTALIITGYRFGLRGLYHWLRRQQGLLGGRRVLVVGAGEGGLMVVRELRANPQLEMEPVAFVDDDPAKIGAHVLGLPVMGPTARIPELVERYRIQRIVLAMPSVPLPRQRELLALCQSTGAATHNLPGVYEILAGHKTISRLPQVDIQHLLKREPVVIDQAGVTALLRGATVLVTGAGGSIGSELCRQIARFQPKELILLGHGENSIFEINLDLRLSRPTLVTRPVIVDVRDEARLRHVVERYRPQVIFHAAAHKHVPLMEDNVEEAISTNIQGTRNVLRAAEACGVERFVLVSSDKAVNPTSVMGATKRMAEMLTVAAAGRSGRAYMAVRFGNVLGSRGSVIPIFQRQIAAGGPLTVTHPEMRRYFMTIPEAVQLLLQAAVLGHGGEVFVLDMGEPVRIVDLAADLVKLSGMQLGRDIDIVYSGVRPGEKLFEELFLRSEDFQRTGHPQIFVAAHEDRVEAQALEQVVLEVLRLAGDMQQQNTSAGMRQLLPEICRTLDQHQGRQVLALSLLVLEALSTNGRHGQQYAVEHVR
jgi:FlaA1/EpsC-like NDP-sugar epimerase/lipopolysaccharide/colanic/teichoic acid biosynthesis glycosyltransferase